MSNRASPGDVVVVHLVGDVGPRRVDYGEEPESLFALSHEKIKEADISFCQLEYNLSTRGCPQYRFHTTWYGRLHPDNVRALVFGGFNVVSHAANHSFDWGPEALLETIDVLRRNDIAVAGVGKDIVEARKPAILERKGVKVGFLAYCSILPAEVEAREEKPGCAPIRVSTYYESQDYAPGMPPKIITIPYEEDVLAMEEDIGKLRNQVDVVVVSMHWGMHSIPGTLAMYEPKVGHKAIDAGADLVVGHHPHLIKGIEIYKGRVIFYSLGSFAQETPKHLKPPPGLSGLRNSLKYRKWEEESGWERYSGPPDKRHSMMVKCFISKNGIQKISFFPVGINQKAEPEILPRNDPRFEKVLQYIGPFCKQLGTVLTVDGDEAIVCPAQA